MHLALFPGEICKAESSASENIWPSYVTMREMSARGLVWSLMGTNLSHRDRSLLRVMSVAMSSLLLTVE